MEPLNNSFPCYYFADKFENMDVDLEEKSNLSTFNINFLKFLENGENLNVNVNLNNNNYNNLTGNNSCKEFNFSPPKDKKSIDISYSMEQTFCENSHINIEEEFQQNEETYLTIGNEGQNPCIDPIQEVDSFERENNESFLHENNYLFDNFNNDNTNSFEMGSSNGFPSDLLKFDSTLEETDICKIRKNIMSLKWSKTANKSDMNINNLNNTLCGKKPVFFTSNTNLLNKSTFASSLNLNTCKDNKLNLSCNLSETLTTNKKRGRKKLLLDGLKTEILDKAFLREFKCYLKKSKSLFKSHYDDLKNEEKIFWNEFMQNNNPPFFFTENRQKVEFKSFSKSLLKFLFSHHSVKQLYTTFVREKEKEIVNSIVSKKAKKVDRKMLLIYSFYGKNLHKLYSSDYNANEINIEDFDAHGIGSSTSTNGISNISDSITNTSTLV